MILSVPKSTTKYAPIAQLDRVFDYESKGHRFESCWARHRKSLVCFALLVVFFFVQRIEGWTF
jgi:hypothetical protein